MSQIKSGSVPKIIVKNILFFAFTFLVTIIGVPAYLLTYHSVPPSILGLMIFYMIATGMGITVGYHRLFAHVTYKAHPVVEFLLLFFGAAAFEQSALAWSSQHRDHHRFVDTDQDPYSIKKGFFYAHIGWLLFWKHARHYENSPDLQKNKFLMHQHKYYALWAIGSGVVVPTVLGACVGHALAAFIFAVCARLVLVHNATFCINSVCHMFGKSTYDIYSTAKDHWLVALITYGEGYHNFHHRFPGDYRNGVRWYQWDPSKWIIALLQDLGWVWDVKRVSDFRILEARLAADQQRVRDWMSQNQESSKWSDLYANLESRYKLLLQKLSAWEIKNKAYRETLYGKFQKSSLHIRSEMDASKKSFQSALTEWRILVRSNAGLAALIL